MYKIDNINKQVRYKRPGGETGRRSGLKIHR